MLNVIRSTLLCVLLTLAVLGCPHPTVVTSSTEVAKMVSECGSALTGAEVIVIVEEAVRASGGDPSTLGTDYQTTIRSDNCDYVFTAIPIGLAAVEGFSMWIDRSGKVKSFPWCCPLGHCQDLCPIEKQQAEESAPLTSFE